MNDVENGMLDYSEYDNSNNDDWNGGWGLHDDDEPFAVYDPLD